MKLKGNIAGGMGQIKTCSDACVVRGTGNSLYIEGLPRVIVYPAKKYKREFMLVLFNRSQYIFSADHMVPLTRFYLDDHLVRIQSTISQVRFKHILIAGESFCFAKNFVTSSIGPIEAYH